MRNSLPPLPRQVRKVKPPPHPSLKQGRVFTVRLIINIMCKEVRKYFATYKVGGKWVPTHRHLDKKALMRELWPIIEANDNLQVTFQVERSYIDDTQK